MNPSIRSQARTPMSVLTQVLSHVRALEPDRAKLYLSLRRFLMTKGMLTYLHKYRRLQSLKLDPMPHSMASRVALKVASNVDPGSLLQLIDSQSEPSTVQEADAGWLTRLSDKGREAYRTALDTLVAAGWSERAAKLIALYILVDLTIIPTLGTTAVLANVVAQMMGPLYFRAGRMSKLGPKLAYAVNRWG